jgi:hypothetical protein
LSRNEQRDEGTALFALNHAGNKIHVRNVLSLQDLRPKSAVAIWFLGVMKRLRGTKLAVKEKHIEEWLRMKERID